MAHARIQKAVSSSAFGVMEMSYFLVIGICQNLPKIFVVDIVN